MVVLGAYGFVGGTCARLLAARGVPVLPLDKDDIDLMASGAAEQLQTWLAPDGAIKPAGKARGRNDMVGATAGPDETGSRL